MGDKQTDQSVGITIKLLGATQVVF